jgi:hypothetical protein
MACLVHLLLRYFLIMALGPAAPKNSLTQSPASQSFLTEKRVAVKRFRAAEVSSLSNRETEWHTSPPTLPGRDKRATASAA